jgi:high-affinity iron transporter
MRIIALGVLLVSACSSQSHAPPPGNEDLRRLSSILDYVAADYPVAVKHGAIIDQGEYDEQISFLKDADALARKLPPSSVDALAAIAETAALVTAKADPAKVAEAARALRRRLLEAHGLVIAPAAPPIRERADELYARNCAACHGAGGAADGPQARGLDPPPRSFVDPEVMNDLTPTRAFNAITDGIRGTAMPGWGTLSPGDRWSLAFHVFTFRHAPEAARRGAELSAAKGRTAAELANVSDAELARELPPDAVAYLRVAAPFAAPGAASLAGARRLVAQGVAAYRAGDALGGRKAVAAAYLDVFEPYEAALRARDSAAVVATEGRFLALREAMADGRPATEIEAGALALDAALERADGLLGGGGGGRVVFAGALVIILREGVEAALLVLLLLGLARRTAGEDDGARDALAVHAGWLAAAGLGVAGWFASGPIVAMGGARRELVEGLIALIAAAVLLATGHFVLARLDAKHRVEAIKRRLSATASGPGRRVALAGLAFVAVFREAFEVVLFLRAIALDEGATPGAIAAGVAAGAAALVVVVAVLSKLGRRLSPGPLLAVMGTLLCVLAVVLAGKGVRSLQEAGVAPIHSLDLPRVDWLGVFPTLEGLAAQLVVLGAFLAIAALAWRARRV